MFIISLTQQFPQPNNGNPLMAVIVQAWQVWEFVTTSVQSWPLSYKTRDITLQRKGVLEHLCKKNGSVKSFTKMHMVTVRMSSMCNEDRFGMWASNWFRQTWGLFFTWWFGYTSRRHLGANLPINICNNSKDCIQIAHHGWSWTGIYTYRDHRHLMTQ